jgi:hypothetical protein
VRISPRGMTQPLVGATYGFALASLMSSRVAHGQQPKTELVWNAPPGCPSQGEVLEEVGRVLGERVAGEGVRATANVSGDEEGWHADLSIDARGATSARKLEAATCPAIASAAAVIIAVAVERGLSPEPPPSLTPAPPVTPPRQARYESRLLVGAGVVFEQGTLPNLAGGAEASLGWLLSVDGARIRVLATGAYFPHASSNPAPGEGADFDLVDVAGRACAAIAAGAFDVGPCVGARFDSMSAFNVRAPQATSRTGEFWSLVGSALAYWHFSRTFALTGRVDVLVPLRRPEFAVEVGQSGVVGQVVYQPEKVSIAGGLGLEVHFF